MYLSAIVHFVHIMPLTRYLVYGMQNIHKHEWNKRFTVTTRTQSKFRRGGWNRHGTRGQIWCVTLGCACQCGFHAMPQNEGCPSSFCWCQSGNNTKRHHDRFILLQRQRGGLKRPGAEWCLQRRTSGQSRNHGGILMQVQGRLLLLHLSASVHPAQHPLC